MANAWPLILFECATILFSMLGRRGHSFDTDLMEVMSMKGGTNMCTNELCCVSVHMLGILLHNFDPQDDVC